MQKFTEEIALEIDNKLREVLDAATPTIPWDINENIHAIDYIPDTQDRFPPIEEVVDLYELIKLRAEYLNMKLTPKAIFSLILLSKGNPGFVVLYLTYIRDVICGTSCGIDLPSEMLDEVPGLRRAIEEYNKHSEMKITVGPVKVTYDNLKTALGSKYFTDEEFSRIWDLQKWYPSDKNFRNIGGNLFDVVQYPMNFVRWGSILGFALKSMVSQMNLYQTQKKE